MKIKKIQIQNFKGFEDSSFEFNEQFTLIHGSNASGKTSLLEGAAFAMGLFLEELTHEFNIDDFPNVYRKIFINDAFEIQIPLLVESTIIVEEAELEFRRDLNTSVQGYSTNQQTYGRRLRVDATQKETAEKTFLPILAFYGVPRQRSSVRAEKNPRAINTISEESSDRYQRRPSRLDTYKNCMLPEFDPEEYVRWFRTIEDDLLKFGKGKEKYQVFVETISELVEGWSEIKYSWREDDIVGKRKDGNWLAFKNLSHGYKSMVNLAGDLAYRCITLNPQLGENAVKQAEGIVLIDELELHLHPKWQKEIVGKLKAVFPKIQFIVTSHSPFILQSMKMDEVINLDGQVLNHNPQNESLDLTIQYMGVDSTKSDEFEHKIKDASTVYELIEQAKNLEGAERESIVKRIDIIIDQYDDPAFVASLKFKKVAKLGVDASS